MKKPEILAPAGNMLCLKAAIEAGCDAVYLAGNLFGARSFAGNFSNDELIEAINYAHLYGVKVYVTVNTIVYEREVERFIEFIRFIHKNNADAVLVQDLGMLDLIRKKFPNLEVHASTQMHIHNFEGACLVKSLGIKRVVMARETPLDVIKKIKNELNIEVETFVHGALCVSYSGQCLMSYLIGGRSGNRGTCSQCCRKKYDIYDQNKNKLNKNNYLLSMKDLFTLSSIDKIIDAGVDSLKIEGRMKRPEYVYIVVSIYKRVVNNYINTGSLDVSDDDINDLLKIFNRKFTKGFILNEDNCNITNDERPNHQGIRVGTVVKSINGKLTIKLVQDIALNDGLRIISKEDHGLLLTKMFVNNKMVKEAKKGDVVDIYYDKKINESSVVIKTTDKRQIDLINEKIKLRTRKVLINVKAKITEKGFYLEVNDGKNIVSLNRKIVSKALKNSTSKELIEKQLRKTGATVYKVNNIKIDEDDNLFINIKDINNLRRDVLDLLDEKRLYKINFIEKDYEFKSVKFNNEKKKVLLVNNEEDYLNNKDKYDLLITENKDLLKYGLCYKLPRVINDYDKYNYDRKVLIGELGSILKYKSFSTDFSFNVVNSYTVNFLHNLGANRVTLSYELNESQIKMIIDNYKERYKTSPNTEVIISSYPEAMICKFDLNKKYNIKEGFLKDEYGNYYKIKSSDDFMKIYNYTKLNYDKEKLLNIGVNYLRMNMDY